MPEPTKSPCRSKNPATCRNHGTQENKSRTLTSAEQVVYDNAYNYLFDSKSTAEILDIICTHPDSRVRLAVGFHENTSDETLVKLTADPDASVVAAVAWNKNASLETLHKIANHPWENPRAALAVRMDTYDEILVKLSTDPSEYVRSSIAGNA